MFSLPNTENLYIIEGEYSSTVVVVSVIIACFASYTALSMNERIKYNSVFHRYIWLGLASIAMGLGVWSMHFIGMSAFMLPIPIEYDVFLTIVSIFPAVFASYLAFYIANRSNVTHWPYIVSAVIMGLGISTMHYVGMAAIELDIPYIYDFKTFSLSIGIAIVVSYIAIVIFSLKHKFMANRLLKMVTAIIMGLAVSSMHYTGMNAMICYAPGPLTADSNNNMHITLLTISITVGITIILALSALSSLLDRYVEYRFNYFDSLTSLPNRRQFEKDLDRYYSGGSLAIIQLYNLDKWNHGYGYSFGDEIIRLIGNIIKEFKTPFGNLYRIDGNRFVIFLDHRYDVSVLKASLKDISEQLKNPITIEHQKLIIEMVTAVSTSMKGESKQKLFANASDVFHHASQDDYFQIIEYDPTIHTYSFEKQLAQEIDVAISNDELFLVYQPKVCSKKREVVGVEALLRWNHPVHGFISPGVFIPILEESGKMYEVTDWIVAKVCTQIALWNEREANSYPVSINIPGPYVTSPQLMRVLTENVAIHQIDSRNIELEITETSVINNIQSAIKAIQEFRDFGFSVALDDFGKGVSSLSYLKLLPISTLKIDKSFIDDVPGSEKDSSIIEAIISLGSSLNLDIVIEGVESEDQVRFLTSMSELPIIQGYYFSKPLKEKDLTDWFHEFYSTT